MAVGGMGWYAPPCKMWLRFLSAATHQRSIERIQGRTDLQKVLDANNCADFTADAITLLWVLGIWSSFGQKIRYLI